MGGEQRDCWSTSCRLLLTFLAALVRKGKRLACPLSRWAYARSQRGSEGVQSRKECGTDGKEEEEGILSFK